MKKSNPVKKPTRDSDDRRKPSEAVQPKGRAAKGSGAAASRQHPDKPRQKLASKAPGADVGQRASQFRSAKPGQGDQREALFNSGAVGVFKEVMVQQHEVTLIRGILIEIDGECLRVGKVITEMPADGFELYESYVRGWLENHPLLSKAEVRFSGRWVHCILHFDTPVEIKSDRRRELWDTVIRAVQRSLPSDPEAPSLLAMTRPIGSVSSKTGRAVEVLKCGEPVTEVEVLNFAEDLTRHGFATFTQILFGTTTVSPCPICCEVDSTLHAAAPLFRTNDPHITNRGTCYECGKVTLTKLVDLVLKGREEVATDDDANSEAVGPASGDEFDDQVCPLHVPADGQGDE
jgi:hypothetical protein